MRIFSAKSKLQFTIIYGSYYYVYYNLQYHNNLLLLINSVGIDVIL